MDPRERLLRLAPEADDETVAVSKRKLEDVLRRLDELEEKAREFEQYKKRHPETVGVKLGKPYALRTPIEPRPVGGRVGARIGHVPHVRTRPNHIDHRVRLSLERCPAVRAGI
ncbi:MAG: hypothetical protein ACREB9_04890 [Thermoplasmata archaeon]